ncbi:MAG: metallophosphoesterase, partial [Clostridia bacterium]|nr:metallophosphoesterase [Clostridia bacterium]
DKTVDYAVPAIDRALAFFRQAGCAHVCAAGDYGIYSEEESYKAFSSATQKGGIPVIACGGNHELYAKIPVMYGEKGYWRTYMNKGVYDRSMPGVLDIASNGIDFTYALPGQENEVFVFLSQWYWDGHTSKQPMLLEPQQLLWLEEQLQQYADKTVFLLFHTYLSDDDGENEDGEGDLKSTGGYSYNGHYNTHTPDEKRLRGLLTKYKNVIWFNGHSHYEYAMQVYNENLNIFDYEGTTATMIHVPSVTNPRTVKPDATTYSSLCGKCSQGALQLVYDGFQIMNGVNIFENEILSYACYIIYTDKKDVVQRGELSDGVCFTFDRQLSSLRITGKGAIPAYNKSSPPWNAYANKIRRLYTAKGITEIGANAFSGLDMLVRAEIKEGVKAIGEKAFHAPLLEKLILPESLSIIESEAFFGSDDIKELIYDGTKKSWKKIQMGERAFANAPAPTPRKMVIGFEDDSGQIFLDVPLGKTPQFDEIPVKNHPSPDKYYVFMGWRHKDTLYPPADP